MRARHAQSPERLKLLKESYQRELERVTVPVNRKYLDALNQLVASYSQAGDSDAALAVREEIKSVLSATARRDIESKESGLLGFKDWLGDGEVLGKPLKRKSFADFGLSYETKITFV